jgi:tRNA A37 methylthiotransferase MiaB
VSGQIRVAVIIDIRDSSATIKILRGKYDRMSVMVMRTGQVIVYNHAKQKEQVHERLTYFFGLSQGCSAHCTYACMQMVYQGSCRSTLLLTGSVFPLSATEQFNLFLQNQSRTS